MVALNDYFVNFTPVYKEVNLILKVNYISNSFVLVARSHNPTLISDYFLTRSGIIKDIKEINPATKIITPPLTQIELLSGTKISLDQERLNITSPLGKEPYSMANAYCKALPYIRGIAIGINFDVDILEYNFKSFFGALSIDSNKANTIRYTRNLGHKLCNITVNMITDQYSKVNFNFHYDYSDPGPIGEIDLPFENEWSDNRQVVTTVIGEIFK